MKPIVSEFVLSRRTILSILAGLPILFRPLGIAALAQTSGDPLASWNDGAAKSSITDFVSRVVTEGGPDFVPEPERIAVFDNDGTL
jgi:hypothetical protein